MKAVGRDEAVPTPRSLWSSPSRTGRSGSLFRILSDASDGKGSGDEKVEVVVCSEMDDDIAREPSLHLPGRREDVVCGRCTTERILSAFGYSNTDTQIGPTMPTARRADTGQTGHTGRSRTSAESTRTNPPSLPSLDARPSARHFSEQSKPLRSEPSRRGRYRRCCCVFCITFLALACCAGISLVLFWPRDPSWQLTKLEVDESIMDLVTALSALPSPAPSPSQLLFRAEASFSNPNLLHGDTSDGALELRYLKESEDPEVDREELLVGRGVSAAATLSPQTESAVVANVTVDLEQNFMDILQQEIVAERWVLAFKLIAACKVRTILNVQLQYRMVCDLDVALSDLMMSETRSRALTVRACKHSFS